MQLTGTIRRGDDIETIDRISAEGPDYAAAQVLLFERLPEGYKVIAIRTDQ